MGPVFPLEAPFPVATAPASKPNPGHAATGTLDYNFVSLVVGARSRFPKAAHYGAAVAVAAVVGCGDVPLDVVVSQSTAAGDDGLTGGSAGAADPGDDSDAGAAIGGAGGSESQPSTSGGATSQGALDVPATAVCERYAAWDAAWTALEETALALINDRRASGAACPSMSTSAVPPLEFDPALRCAARLHSLDMATRDFFSQGTWNDSAPTCTSDGDCGAGQLCDARLPGETPQRCLDATSVRLQLVGWSGRAWAELISGGSETAALAVDYWMSSAGTCALVMAGDRTHIGIGYAAGGPYDHTWTVVTGSY